MVIDDDVMEAGHPIVKYHSEPDYHPRPKLRDTRLVDPLGRDGQIPRLESSGTRGIKDIQHTCRRKTTVDSYLFVPWLALTVAMQCESSFSMHLTPGLPRRALPLLKATHFSK